MKNTFLMARPTGCKWNESQAVHWFTYESLVGVSLTALGDLAHTLKLVFARNYPGLCI